MQFLASLFPMKPVRCPCCRLRIHGQHVWFHRSCAACGAVFRIRRLYFFSLYVIALVASFAIAFAIGNRGDALGSLAALLAAPAFWGILQINLRLFPADIEVVHPGWTPGDSEGDRELEQGFVLLREVDPVLSWDDAEALPPRLEEATHSAPSRLPLSTPKDPPITLEGIAIAVAFAVLLAYHAYVAIEPHIK